MTRRSLLLAASLGLLLGLGSPHDAFAASAKAPPKGNPPRAAARSAPSKVPETGIASWYRSRQPMVGAHRTLPFGSKVKVVARNGRSVVITVRGRGPFVKGRVVDLSSDAFKQLASLGTGVLRVHLEVVPQAAQRPKKLSASR